MRERDGRIGGAETDSGDGNDLWSRHDVYSSEEVKCVRHHAASS